MNSTKRKDNIDENSTLNDAWAAAQQRSYSPPRDRDNIFAEFFGVPGDTFDGGSSNFFDGGGSKRTADNIFEEFFPFGGKTAGDDGGDGRFKSSEAGSRGNKKKAPAIESKLACTLEELYNGASKKMRISRVVLDVFGNSHTVEEILKIDLKPGWKKGTKITFQEKGNQEPGFIPADLIFVVDEKPHSVYKRDGNDLIVEKKISLLDALTGLTIGLTTLDGRNLTIPVLDIVKPGQETVIPNEGMPTKDSSKRGNLRINFEILFPSRRTSEQKNDLKRALA